MDIISRYASADEAEADIRARVERKEIVIGFGHPVYTIGDPRNPIIKEISRKLCHDGGNMTLFDVSERIENVMMNMKKMFPNRSEEHTSELQEIIRNLYAVFC